MIMIFNDAQKLIINSALSNIKNKAESIKMIESYYMTHDDILTRFVMFNKTKLGTELVFKPRKRYYFITDGIIIIGIDEMKKDQKTGKYIVPKKKFLMPKQYNKKNLKYLHDFLHGDIDNDGIPNIDDLHPHVASNTSAEELSLSRNLKEIDIKRRKLKQAMESFVQDLSPLTKEFDISARAKTPVSIINKLQSKYFTLDNPIKSVIEDSIGAFIYVDNLNELKLVEKFIDTTFDGRILEKDDKYDLVKKRWCLESIKINGKNTFIINEKCEKCKPKCEIVSEKYSEIRAYTALAYKILIKVTSIIHGKEGDEIALIAEIQVKTRIVKKLSEWIHGIYKIRDPKYNFLFEFLYDVAEQADIKGKYNSKLERMLLRHFYLMRGTKTEQKAYEPSHYIPPELIKEYYANGKILPSNLKEILQEHEKKVLKR